MSEPISPVIIECAIGGQYEMPDGRAFWIDGPVAKEMTRRVMTAIAKATEAIAQAMGMDDLGDDPPVVRYTTDDMDVDRHVSELQIQPGGNGDWYVAIAPQGFTPVSAVRITTSGSRVEGLAAAIADAYRAILAAGSRAIVTVPRRAPAPSDLPSPDASRTDAVRAAIALVKRHEGRGSSTVCFWGAPPATKRPYSAKFGNVCADADNLRPVVAALADAERKLAEERERDQRVVNKLRIEREHSDKLTHQLADAEERAKDIDRINGDLRGERVEKIELIASLTRQLVTALEGLHKIGALFCVYDQPGSGPSFGGGRCPGPADMDCCAHRMARATLAAIDAPAGEEPASTFLSIGCFKGKSTTAPRRSRVAITKSIRRRTDCMTDLLLGLCQVPYDPRSSVQLIPTVASYRALRALGADGLRLQFDVSIAVSAPSGVMWDTSLFRSWIAPAFEAGMNINANYCIGQSFPFMDAAFHEKAAFRLAQEFGHMVKTFSSPPPISPIFPSIPL